MYRWLRRRLPAPLVNLLYSLWYALWMLAVFYLLDRPPAAFAYLHQ